jgi:hypothetical protein
LQLAISSEPYAQYGVTSGCVTFTQGHTAIILAKHWPSWAFNLASTGFQLRTLVLLDAKWLSTCKRLLPPDLVLLYSEFLLDQACTLAADVVISDIDPPASFQLWRRVHLIYISRQGVKHRCTAPPAFVPHFSSISHEESGGVTMGHWTLRFYIHHSLTWDHQSRPTCTRRDLSTIVTTTSGVGLPCPAPPPLPHLHDCLLRPNTYHGSGLFPFHHRMADFVVPSVYSYTHWCRRHLTAEETLLTLDVSDTHVKLLSSGERRELCNDEGFVPGKVVQFFLHQAAQALDKLLTSLSPSTTVPQRPSITADGLPVPDSSSLTFHGDRHIHTLTSSKADDATVPIYLWNDFICPNTSPTQAAALDVFRHWRLRLWRKAILKDFLQWFYRTHHIKGFIHRPSLSRAAQIDCRAGTDCLSRCMGATWWEWAAGSRPHFWRWPLAYQGRIRDGITLWFTGEVIKWRRPQPTISDPRVWQLVRTKIRAVREKGYIVPGDVHSLTSFFAVPKGEADIRMVYDGTKSGLNGKLWAPWFPLPTIESHLRATLPGYFMSDIDIGEMFLNFMLHESVQKYCGVDLTTLFPDEVPLGQVL